VYDPGVFAQSAFTLQVCVPVVHSLISVSSPK